MDLLSICKTEREEDVVKNALRVMDRAYIKNIKEKPLHIIISEMMMMRHLMFIMERWVLSKVKLEQETLNCIVKNYILILKLLDFDNINTTIPFISLEEYQHIYELEEKGISKKDLINLKYLIYNILNSYKLDPFIYQHKTFMYQYKQLTVTLDRNDAIFLYGDMEYCIDIKRYNKLKIAYSINVSQQSDLNERMFKMIIKNKIISHHNGLSKNLFSLIKRHLKINMELFSSPLNYQCDIYGSAHPDVDGCFGSKGNFFDIYSRAFRDGGSFEAFPPCIVEYIGIFSVIVCNELETNKKPLSFFIALPHRIDMFSNTLLTASKWLRFQLLSKTQRKSSKDSEMSNKKLNIFILQNDAGAEEYKITDDFIAGLKENFNDTS